MKVDSIKYRLLLITFVCVSGMLLLVFNQIYYTDRLIELNQQNQLLMRLSNELLQLRRHEKDFLLRKQTRYAQSFEGRAQAFNKDLGSLNAIFTQHNVDPQLMQDMQSSFTDYQHKFEQMVLLLIQIGLDKSKGQTGQVHNALISLRDALDPQNLVSIQGKLMRLREYESDFLLYQEMSYVEKFEEEYQTFVGMLSQSADQDHGPQPNHNQVHQKLMAYRAQFLQLVESYQSMGLSHNDGLRGAFRSQAHIVEDHLLNIDNTLNPIIKREEHRVKTNGLMIMGLTIIALLVIIVRSFVTFQRAFSNFVMFFYRCKREYQRMDERKLGFSEFKSLAAVANEMVESRQQTEAELREVKKELASLKKVNEQE